jgi:glycogen(starch) synthase
MRILFWTESFFPRIGGSEVAAGVLIQALKSRGHQFRIVTRQWSSDHPIDDTWLGIPVHRVPFNEATFDRRDLNEILPLRQRVAAIKRQFQPDLVHIGLTGPSLFLHNFTAGQFPTPTAITLHVAPMANEFGRNKPVHEALDAATAVVAVSHATKAIILQRLPEIADRCTVIHNALPDPSGAIGEPTFSPPRLLCIGRVTEQKGFDTAIAAMPAILSRFPDAQLIIAGDGELTEPLRELARQLNLLPHLRLLGWTPPEQIPTLIDTATLVLVPSRWEPFGLVALQAGQRGRVCLASNIDGLPEVVQHLHTGLLLPPDKPDQWAEAISTLLADRPRIASMGRSARQFVARHFRLSDHVDAYESLYRRLAGAGRLQEATA